jgi:hypothetical protein
MVSWLARCQCACLRLGAARRPRSREGRSVRRAIVAERCFHEVVPRPIRRLGFGGLRIFGIAAPVAFGSRLQSTGWQAWAAVGK